MLQMQLEFELMNEMYFQWNQLKHAIAAKGKNKLLNVDMLTGTTCIKTIVPLKERELCL